MFPFLALNIFIFISCAIAAIVYTILLFIGSDHYSSGIWFALIIASGLYSYQNYTFPPLLEGIFLI